MCRWCTLSTHVRHSAGSPGTRQPELRTKLVSCDDAESSCQTADGLRVPAVPQLRVEVQHTEFFQCPVVEEEDASHLLDNGDIELAHTVKESL